MLHDADDAALVHFFRHLVNGALGEEGSLIVLVGFQEIEDASGRDCCPAHASASEIGRSIAAQDPWMLVVYITLPAVADVCRGEGHPPVLEDDVDLALV